MLYEARRHMPSEPGCLLSQGSWVDRLGLAPSSPQSISFLPQTNTPVMGKPIALVVHGLLCVFMCVGGECVWRQWWGWLLSDLNTSDIVVSPGRNSWSAGEKGGCGEAGIRKGRRRRWEAVRYTDNGIRLKHSVRDRPLLFVKSPQILRKNSQALYQSQRQRPPKPARPTPSSERTPVPAPNLLSRKH